MRLSSQPSEPIQPSQPTEPGGQAGGQPTEAGGAGAGPTSKGKYKRKKRPPVTMTQNQEEAAVEFLKRHEVLYNRGLKEYKDTDKRDKLWAKLASKLSTKDNKITKEDIKKWFESQRTVYGKCTQVKSGQAARHSIREKTVGGDPV